MDRRENTRAYPIIERDAFRSEGGGTIFKLGIVIDRWHHLTEPSAELHEPIRRQARLLSSLLLVSLLIAFPAILLGALEEQLRLGSTALSLWMTYLIGVLILAAAYVLSRTRHYMLAATFTVILLSAITYGKAAEGSTLLQLEYVLISVLMASLFLSLRSTVLTLALALGAILVFPVIRPDTQATIILAALRFVCVFGTLFIVVAVTRQRDLEHIKRQAQELSLNEERFRTLIENSSDVIMSVNVDGTVNYLSPSGEHVLGYRPEEFVGKNVFEYVHPDNIADTMSAFRQTFEHPGVVVTVELQFRNRDGSWRYFEAAGTAHSNPAAEPTCVINTRDVTDRKKVQAALQQANAELTTSLRALEQHNHVISLLNAMTDDLQVCLTVAEASLVIAHSVSRIFSAESGALYMIAPSRDILEAIATWGDAPPAAALFAPDECWGLRRGQPYLSSDERSAIRCAHVTADIPAPICYLCVPMLASGDAIGVFHLRCASTHAASNVHAKQQLAVAVAEQIALSLSNIKLRETLRQQSIRDPLTGLFNRRYLDETLTRELRRAERRQVPLGIIMFDLDHFKIFNDTFGHAAGDIVLRELGAFLQTSIRAEDVACRYGGEEFVVILPETSLEDTVKRAEQLGMGIKELNVRYQDQALGVVTVSLGVAIFPEHGSTTEAILKAADAALYRAKHEGRDRVVVAADASVEAYELRSLLPTQRNGMARVIRME